MQSTLLEIVQDILSSMDSDEVNSITDTAEADQVARLVRRVYYDVAAELVPDEHYSLFQLTASGDSAKPVLMTLPSTANSVLWLKYNKAEVNDTNPLFQHIKPMASKDFIEMSYNLQLDADNTDEMVYNNITYLYRNDKHPDWYTSFDDETLIFDSYQSSVDTTLQTSKSLSYGIQNVAFSLTDTFVPDLEDDQFPLFFNECKALAFAEMKQAVNAKAEKNARQGWIRSQKKKSNFKQSALDRAPNYGR